MIYPAFSVDRNVEDIALYNLTFEEAIQALTPIQRLVLMLRYDTGLPQTNVAEMLGLTQGRVSILESKALRLIRKFMVDE